MNKVFSPLQDDLLYLFALGPGFGESTLIRVPPNLWIVIDSFRIDSQAAAVRVLTHYQAFADCLLLTHPHQDHYPGFVELIDHSPHAIIGCVHPSDPAVFRDSTVDAMQTFGNAERAVFDRVMREWREDRSRAWRAFRNNPWNFPGGSLMPLHPTLPLQDGTWVRPSFNDLSIAALLRWGNAAILLGADITNVHGCWDDICNCFNGLRDHTVAKLPHHGSRESHCDAFAQGDRSRCWIVTPYSKGRDKLPRFEDGQGVSKILGYVDELFLTSLPGRLAVGPELSGNVKRKDLIGAYVKNGAALTLNEKLQRCVAIGVDRNGNVIERRFGSGSLQVTDG